ncbi:MAG TPA: hypothetical protein VNO18_08295 [Xanthobacteraceae bacterium]|jgi:hypothetical protein|nr:hypothetical protein [Xanthobacteraceae bacterium]
MSTKAKRLAAAEAQLLHPEFKPMPQPSVGMYLCAFHVGRWEPDESVVDAYHRALDITAVQFHRMLRDDFSALKEKHADAVYKMMVDRGVDLMTCSEAEKEMLWLTLVEEARKGGMRLPA